MELYVTTSNLYNNGIYKGKWVDVTGFKSQEEFMKHCREIFKDEDTYPEPLFLCSIGIPNEYVFLTKIREDFFKKYKKLLKNREQIIKII